MSEAQDKQPETPKEYDFFISYRGKDDAWAQWIAWQLKAAGFEVFLQAWNFQTGDNVIAKMQEGLTKSERAILLLSPHYFESPNTTAEWTAAIAKVLADKPEFVIPVLIEKCDLGLLAPYLYIDLNDIIDPAAARKRLLDGIKPNPGAPTTEPPFPRRSAAAPTPQSVPASPVRSQPSATFRSAVTITSPVATMRLSPSAALCFLANRLR
jgi:hypothetical protein